MPDMQRYADDALGLVDQFGKPFDRGQDVIPHHISFAAIYNTISQTYPHRWDEAIRHARTNALAMRRDAFVRSLLQERYLPTARRKWEIQVDNPNDPYQQQVKDGLTKVVKATKRFAVQRLYLLDAVWYGRYGSQVRWGQQNIDGEAMWCLTKHTPVNGDKIQGAWDDTPAILVNQSWLEEQYKPSVVHTDINPALRLERPEWRQQFIIHRHQVDDADYFDGERAGAVQGCGLRDMMYWNWWLRDECLSWAIDFMKKVGTFGLLVAWYDLSSKQSKEEAERIAKRANKDTVVLMGRPPSSDRQTYGLERIEGGMGGIEALQRLIQDYFEYRIERLVVGQTLSSGTEGSGLGGTGVADLHADTKYQLLAFDAENLDETLTDDFIAVAKQFNYPWADFPARFKSIVPDPEADKKLEAGVKLISAGVQLKADELREQGGLTKPEEGDEIVGGPPTMPGMVPGQGVPAGQPQPIPDSVSADTIPAGTEGQPEPSVADLFRLKERLSLYEAGRWVTIGGQEGEDGKRKGGSPVYIVNGRITKGHPRLTGKRIDNLEGDAEHGTARKQLADSKSYAKAKWAKKAKRDGIPADALHSLAKEITNQHREQSADRIAAIRLARSTSERLGYGSLQGMAARNARGTLDAAGVKGLDDVAEIVSKEYPHLFSEGQHKDDRMLEILIDGMPEPISEEDAYEQAYEVLSEGDWSKAKTDDESFDLFAYAGFDPNEPRDSAGRWSGAKLKPNRQAIREGLNIAGSLDGFREMLDQEDPRDHFTDGWSPAYQRIARVMERHSNEDGTIDASTVPGLGLEKIEGEDWEDAIGRALDKLFPPERVKEELMAEARAILAKRKQRKDDPESYAWVPHTIAHGPRKGQQAWLHEETGELRDTPPDSVSADSPQPAGTAGGLPAELADPDAVRSNWERIRGVFAGLKDSATNVVRKALEAANIPNAYNFLTEVVIPTAHDWSQAWAAKHLDPLQENAGIRVKDLAYLVAGAMGALVGKVAGTVDAGRIRLHQYARDVKGNEHDTKGRFAHKAGSELDDWATDNGYDGWDHAAEISMGLHKTAIRAGVLPNKAAQDRSFRSVMDAVDHFQRRNYVINRQLRAGEKLNDEDQEAVNHLDRLSRENKLPVDAELYRVVGERALKPGDVLQDNGFVFASASRDYVKNIDIAGPKMTMVILADKGAKAFSMGKSEGGSRQVVLPRHAELEVVKVEGDTITCRYRKQSDAVHFSQLDLYDDGEPDSRVEALRDVLNVFADALGVDPAERPGFDDLLGMLDARQPATDRQYHYKRDAKGNEHQPAGTPEGGRFAPKDSVSADSPRQAHAEKKAAFHARYRTLADRHLPASRSERLAVAAKAMSADREVGHPTHAEAVSHALLGRGAELHADSQDGFDAKTKLRSGTLALVDAKTATSNQREGTVVFYDKEGPRRSKVTEYQSHRQAGHDAIPAYHVFTDNGIFLHFGFDERQQVTSGQTVDPKGLAEHLRGRKPGDTSPLPTVKLASWPDGWDKKDLATKIADFHKVGDTTLDEHDRNFKGAMMAVEKDEGIQETFDQQAEAVLVADNKRAAKVNGAAYIKGASALSDEEKRQLHALLSAELEA